MRAAKSISILCQQSRRRICNKDSFSRKRWNSNTPNATDEKASKKISKFFAATVGVVGITAGSSVYTRQVRDAKLDEVPLASECGRFTLEDEVSHSEQEEDSNPKSITVRSLKELDMRVQRTGLMGKSVPGSKSVKEELQEIRKWHQDRNFQGGVVLRELTVPVFGSKSNTSFQTYKEKEKEEVKSFTKEHLSQRECYYLYYEIKPNGHNHYCLFCRGTTMFEDVKTCLDSKLEYDDELGIHLHRGFKDHAQRLADDVEPLLGGTKNNDRATIEVSGHSLGGAVAFIVAMKLIKRGYNVKSVLSVAGARYVAEEDVQKAKAYLPKDSLRIEDDLDCVPFLPPWAASLGDRLWITNVGNRASVKFIAFDEHDQHLEWTDDVFTNLRLPEALMKQSETHRIRSYLDKLSTIQNDLQGTKI